jgi:hypothetical protein
VLDVAAIILAVSVQRPGLGAAPTLYAMDRSVSLHVVASAGLAGTVGYGLARADRRAPLPAVAAAGYVAAVELVQAPLGYRTARVVDALLNTTGAVVGAVLWRAVASRFVGDGTTSI